MSRDVIWKKVQEDCDRANQEPNFTWAPTEQELMELILRELQELGVSFEDAWTKFQAGQPLKGDGGHILDWDVRALLWMLFGDPQCRTKNLSPRSKKPPVAATRFLAGLVLFVGKLFRSSARR